MSRRKRQNQKAVSYQSLEKRNLLASFNFTEGTMFLDDFAAGENTTIFQIPANINGQTRDAFVFQVQGSWSGDDSDPLIEIESTGGTNNRLEIAESFFAGNRNFNIDATDNVVDFDVLTDLLLENFAIRTSGDFAPLGINGADTIALRGNIINSSSSINARDWIYIEGQDGATVSEVTTESLMIGGRGDFDFVSPNNSIEQLSSNVTGSVSFEQADGFDIANLTDVRRNQKGLVVRGTANLASGTGSIIQDSNAKAIATQQLIISAGVDIGLTGGDADGDGDFDNNYGRVSATAGGDVQIFDEGNLIVDAAFGAKLFFRSGVEGNGRMVMNGDFTASEQILIQSRNGAQQRAGRFATPELIFGGDTIDEARGVFAIRDTDTTVNDVPRIVASVIDGGVQVRVGTEIEIGGNLTFENGLGALENFAGFETSRASRITSDTSNVVLRERVAAGLFLEVNAGGNISDTAGTTIEVDQIRFNAGLGINLANSADDMMTISQFARYNATGTINVGQVGTYNARFTRFETNGNVNLNQTGRLIMMENNRAANANLTAEISILNALNTTVNIDGNAVFTADRGISLGENAGDSIMVCDTFTIDVNNFIQLLEPGEILVSNLDIVPNGANEIITIDGGC